MYQKLLNIKKADKRDEPIIHMDTLITQLVDYYEHMGSQLKLSEAYYYAGRVFSERHEVSVALVYFQKAADELPNSDDSTLEDVIYSQIGYLLSYQDLHEEAINAFYKSYRAGNVRNDTLVMIYGLRDMALEYKRIGNYKQSMNYLTKALSLSQENKKAYMYYALKAHIASLHYIKKDYNTALNIIQSIINDTDPKDQSGTYTIASKIYKAVGMIDSAEYYSKKLLKIGTLYAKCSANERLAEIAVLHKQPEQALRYLMEYKRLNDSINKITNTENIAKIHAMYNYQKHEQENLKLREENHRKNLLLIIALLMVITLGLVCVAGGLLYRKHKKTIWLKSELLEGINRQLAEKEGELAEKKRIRLQTADISKHIFELLENPSDKRLRLTDDDWCNLNQTVNAICPRFSERLKGFCGLSDYELQVCLLRKIGVTPSKIALLLNRSKQAINSTRERLYQKAFGQKGSPSQWDDYLQTL